jgi:glutamyl-Q tRNA(Asp) synthetase
MQQQDVASEVGDFVLKRADGCFTYQLAVVVDDAAQGITHVVRGTDLADNTARQIFLQRLLGLPTLAYRHTPLVLGTDGEKLSKQNGAKALDTSNPDAALDALRQAAQTLGLDPAWQTTVQESLLAWVAAWREMGRMPPSNNGAL